MITGDGLAAALEGVEVVIDVTTRPSPEQGPATEFFTTATRNLEEAGVKAGVRRLVVVSIIGVDKSAAGYGAAKLAHERAALAGPIPARILRAAQFHEFVEVLMGWGRQGDVVYLPRGTVHEGTSNETASMHLTIGLHPKLWATVLKNAIQSVIDSNGSHPA